MTNDTKIYVVSYGMQWEGGDVEGAFVDQDKAFAFADEVYQREIDFEDDSEPSDIEYVKIEVFEDSKKVNKWIRWGGKEWENK